MTEDRENENWSFLKDFLRNQKILFQKELKKKLSRQKSIYKFVEILNFKTKSSWKRKFLEKYSTALTQTRQIINLKSKLDLKFAYMLEIS